MGSTFTRKSFDHSDTESFSFSYFCDRCGKGWTSRTQPFSSGGFESIVNDEAKMLLWADERRSAAASAMLEARFHFNYCPICGRWVCNDCFLAEDDMCMDCRASPR